MSVRVMTWAWAVDCASSGEKLVLLALADHAGEDGTCYPSSGALAEKTGLGNSTVRHHLDALEERGVLSRVRRRRRDGKLGTYRYMLGSTAGRSAVEPEPTDEQWTSADPPAPVRARPAPTGARSTAGPSARVTVTEPSLTPPGGALASSLRPEPSSRDRLVGVYAKAYAAKRRGIEPPKQIRGRAAKAIGAALAEGLDPDVLEQACRRLGDEGRRPDQLLTVYGWVLEQPLVVSGWAPPPRCECGAVLIDDGVCADGCDLGEIIDLRDAVDA